jgi:hypothetical protein
MVHARRCAHVVQSVGWCEREPIDAHSNLMMEPIDRARARARVHVCVRACVMCYCNWSFAWSVALLSFVALLRFAALLTDLD